MGIIICSNCGGQFKSTESKCPYCDMIYEPGAENEYKEKLGKIRSDLDVVDNLAEDEVKKDLKKFLTAILISSVISGLIVIFIISGNRVATTGERSINRSMVEREMECAKNFFIETEKWDKLYEEGKYEELVGSIDDYDKYRTNSNREAFMYATNYEHYEFVREYKELMDIEKTIEEHLFSNYYFYRNILREDLDFDLRYIRNRNSYYLITDEEKIVINEKYQGIHETIMSIMELSEEDYEALMSQAIEEDYSYVSYELVENFVSERYGK